MNRRAAYWKLGALVLLALSMLPAKLSATTEYFAILPTRPGEGLSLHLATGVVSSVKVLSGRLFAVELRIEDSHNGAHDYYLANTISINGRTVVCFRGDYIAASRSGARIGYGCTAAALGIVQGTTRVAALYWPLQDENARATDEIIIIPGS